MNTPATSTDEHLTVRDGDYAQRVRASFAKQRIMKWLGARMTRIEPGCCEIQLPFKPELTQQNGYFHGGIVGTIADSAGGYAGMSLMPPGAAVLTVEYKLNLVAPADGELLTARGQVVKAGRTLVIATAEVSAIKNGVETLCASMLQTLITLHDKPA